MTNYRLRKTVAWLAVLAALAGGSVALTAEPASAVNGVRTNYAKVNGV